MNEIKESLQHTRELLLTQSEEVLISLLEGNKSNFNDGIIKESVYQNKSRKLFQQHRYIIHQINKVDEMLTIEEEKEKNVIAGEN